MNFSPKQINNAFETISPVYRDALLDVNFQEKVDIILNTYIQNNPDLLIDISNNYTYFLIGLMKIDALETYIKEVILDKELSNIILNSLEKDVYQEIIKKSNELEDSLKFDSGVEDKFLNQDKEYIYNIGKKYNLNIEESGILEEVITKTLDGIYEANLFKILLKERINIDEEKLESLIKEVNENIFKKIRQNLIENSNKRDLDEPPLPPYKKEVVDEIPLPPNLKIEEIQNIETVPLYNNQISSVIDEKTILSDNTNTQNINNSMDIVSDKLFKNTVSKTGVTDYSLPKMKKDSYSSLDTGSFVKNPHDPYHEIV